MPGSRKTIKGSNCKNKIVGPYDEDTIERLKIKAHQDFHGKENTNNNKRPSQRCSRYSDVELKRDEPLQPTPSKPVGITMPKIKKTTTYNGPPNYTLLPERQPCHYGGKPKKTKTKKAKKSKKVRKINKSRKSTNFLFNLFK